MEFMSRYYKYLLVVTLDVGLILAAPHFASEQLGFILLLLTYSYLVFLILLLVFPIGHRKSWACAAILGWAAFLPLFVFAGDSLVKDSLRRNLFGPIATRVLPMPKTGSGETLTTTETIWPEITYVATIPGISASTRHNIDLYNEQITSYITIGYLYMVTNSVFLGFVIGRLLESFNRQGGRLPAKRTEKVPGTVPTDPS